MNRQDDKLKDIFQDAFESFEAPVKPSAWSGIESGLNNSAGAAGGGEGAGSTVSGWVSSNLAWIAGGAIVATTAVVVAVNVWTSDQPEENITTQQETTQIKEPESNSNEQQSEPTEGVVPEKDREPVNNSEGHQNSGNTDDSFAEAPDLPGSEELNESQEPSGAETVEPEEGQVENGSSSTGTTSTERNVEAENSSAQSPDKASDDDKSLTKDPVVESELTANFHVKSAVNDPYSHTFSAGFVEAESFHWNFGDGKSVTTEEPTVEHEYSEMGDFEVELTVKRASNTKSQSQIVEVYEESELVLPNVITPNGDGLNDYFDIHHAESKNILDYEIKVFSVSNELIFSSHEGAKRWNGEMPDGSPAPAGQYVVVVKAKGMDGKPLEPEQKFITLRR